MTYWDGPGALESIARDAESTASAPRVSDPPTDSSLIQPLTTLPRPQTSQTAQGTLQLEVGPNTAQVYVDGFYVGTVEEISRRSTGLNLDAGWHRLEFRAPGYLTPAVNVTIDANRHVTYRGNLSPIAR